MLCGVTSPSSIVALYENKMLQLLRWTQSYKYWGYEQSDTQLICIFFVIYKTLIFLCIKRTYMYFNLAFSFSFCLSIYIYLVSFFVIFLWLLQNVWMTSSECVYSSSSFSSRRRSLLFILICRIYSQNVKARFWRDFFKF